MLEKRIAQMIEKIAVTIMRPLLWELKVSIEKRMYGQVQSLVNNQLPATQIFSETQSEQK